MIPNFKWAANGRPDGCCAVNASGVGNDAMGMKSVWKGGLEGTEKAEGGRGKRRRGEEGKRGRGEGNYRAECFSDCHWRPLPPFSLYLP